jgi:putative transposase
VALTMNSHRPVRKRERAMQRFKSPEQAQRFLETFSAVCNHFRPRPHRLTAISFRHIMRERFEQWWAVMGVETNY